MKVNSRTNRGSKQLSTKGFCLALVFLFTYSGFSRYYKDVHSVTSSLLEYQSSNSQGKEKVDEQEKANGFQFTDEETTENSQLVQKRRKEFEHQCAVPNTTNTIESLTKDLFHSYESNNDKEPNAASTDIGMGKVIPCNYTFLDFGANVGDSLGKFVDSGIPDIDCNGRRRGFNKLIKYCREWLKLRFAECSGTQRGRKYCRLPLQSRSDTYLSRNLHPEEFCYYGIEGNPVFTNQLKHLERRVMASHPRPLRNAHFFTETVSTASDGPTVLYLDTINTNKNFWGSSILASHPDVTKSAELNNKDPQNLGKPIEAPVMGLTLTTLIDKTVNKHAQTYIAFNNGDTDHNTGDSVLVAGPQLIIKMDIEGAEYSVLNEAYDSGVLCRYVHQYNATIYLLLEQHNRFVDVIDNPNSDFQRFKNVVQPALTKECNIIASIGSDAGR